MDAPPSDRLRATLAELAGAGLILVWRAIAVPITALPADWLAVLAAFWIVTVLTERSRFRPWITVGSMALLLTLYLWGQLPAAAAFLRGTL